MIVPSSILADEEVRRFIIVFILKFNRFGNIIEIIAVGNDVNVRPSGFDSVIELHVSLHVVVSVEHELLLISHFKIFQVERFRVSVFSPHLSIESVS